MPTRISAKCCSAAGRIDAWLANFAPFRGELSECAAARGAGAGGLPVPRRLRAARALSRRAAARGVPRRRRASARRLPRGAADSPALYFDVEPEMLLKFAQTYDATAKRVYGEPLPRPPARRPGRLRIGYLSADLRNHVMGKMMWQAIAHHDRARFELFFYSLATRERRLDRALSRRRGPVRGDRGPARARRGAAHRRRRPRRPGRPLDAHQGREARHSRVEARARADHARGERRNGRPVGGRLQADRPLCRHPGEPGVPARGAAGDGRLRLSVPPHRARRRAPFPPRRARHRRRHRRDRRVRQRPQAVAALSRAVARGARAHSPGEARVLPGQSGAARALRQARRRRGHCRRAPAVPPAGHGATPRTSRATSSSTSCSIRCPMAGSTARWRRSTWACRW